MDDSGEYEAILVSKSRRELSLVGPGTDESFPVLVGLNPGHKEQSGDCRTPEGTYFVLRMLPDEDAVGTGYYRGLHFSYPSPCDAREGLKKGLIDEATHDSILSAYRVGRVPPQETALGGFVAIHGGLSPEEKFERGTKGCIVLRNADMDRLYAFARAGMPVLITP